MNRESATPATDVVERARRVVKEVIAPRAAHHDETGEFPAEGFRALGEAGLLGLFVPARYGGLEADYRTFARVVEIIASGCASTSMIYVMHHNQYIMVVDHGTEQQRAFFLPPIARGESIVASATTEPETGGNAEFCTSAKRLVGDRIVLSAKKPVVTAARYAAWVFCTTRASEASPGNVLSMVAMPGASAEGVTPFGAWDCVGMRATSSSGLEYRGCEVPAWHQIGPDDSSMVRATSMTVASRLGFSAAWVGIAQSALDQAIAHVTQRRHEFVVAKGQAGSETASVQKSLADYETVQRQVAEMYVRVEGARQLVLAAAAHVDAARATPTSPVSEEALPAIHDLLWSARLASGEAAIEVTRIALRVCGVQGLRQGLLTLERNMRDALTAQVMAPSEDIVKLALGRKILGVKPPHVR